MAESHNHELAGRQLVSVFLECRVEVIDLALQVRSGKPEEQDAGVSEPLMKD
jgi:hypothetical protein